MPLKKKNQQRRKNGIHNGSRRLCLWSLIFIDIFLLRDLSVSYGSVRHNGGKWARSEVERASTENC